MLAHRLLARHRLTILTTLSVLSILSGCSDSTGPGDRHEDPAGLRAVVGGTTIVSVNAARQVTGSFAATVGAQSELIQVQFLDEDGDVISPSASSYYLRVQLGNSALATVQQSPAGAYSFRLQGLAAGTTTMQLSLMHGQHPGGHSDYTSPNITVVVTP